MTAPIGAVVGLTYDTRSLVSVGDVIETATTGRTYLIVECRRSTGSRSATRWVMRCLVIAPEDAPTDVPRHVLQWYTRNRR